jgi:uncharacterized membrane protein YhiD involved in acid resistance
MNTELLRSMMAGLSTTETALIAGTIGIVAAGGLYFSGAYTLQLMNALSKIPKCKPKREEFSSPKCSDIDKIQPLDGLIDADLDLYIDRSDRENSYGETNGYRVAGTVGKPSFHIHENAFEQPLLLLGTLTHEYAHFRNNDPRRHSRLIATGIFVMVFSTIFTVSELVSGNVRLASGVAIVSIMVAIAISRIYHWTSRKEEENADEWAARQVNSRRPIEELLDDCGEHEESSSIWSKIMGGSTHPSPDDRSTELENRFDSKSDENTDRSKE